MRIPKLEIRTFYLIGSILMVFSIIGSIWNLNVIWGALNGGGKMSGLAGVLFNFLWLGLFLFLYKMTPKQEPNVRVIEDPKIEKLLNDLTKTEKEVKNGRHIN